MTSPEQEFTGRGFRLSVRGERLALVIDSGAAAALPVTADEIEAFFKSQGWPWVCYREVAEALQAPLGEDHIIIDDLSRVRADARINLRISTDNLQVYGQIRPAVWGKKLTQADILTALSNLGIAFGVRGELLERALANQQQTREWLLAEGQAPRHGQDAKLVYEPVLEKTNVKPAFLADGRVDFRELDNISVVTNGQLLATRVPPTPGIAGKNVLGKEIPAVSGRDLVWPLGKGVRISGDKLVAANDGQIVFQGGKISVLAVYDVPGNVDYSVGNIRFNGNVQVRGSVKPGFIIEAQGDVRVFGGVEAASITCGGTLTVTDGIQGQGRGEVKAGGDVVSRFIENCTVSAGGAVTVGEDIMHSRVFAGRSISVGGRRGLIVGGLLKATDYIECKVLGATLGTATVLEVGVDPAAFAGYGELQAERVRIEEELLRLKQGISRLTPLKENAVFWTAEREALFEQLCQAFQQRSAEASDLVWRIAEQEQAFASIGNAYIRASQNIYPGITVVIGRASYHVHDFQPVGGRFRLVKGEITLSTA